MTSAPSWRTCGPSVIPAPVHAIQGRPVLFRSSNSSCSSMSICPGSAFLPVLTRISHQFHNSSVKRLQSMGLCKTNPIRSVFASAAKQSLARHQPAGQSRRFKRLPRRAEALLAMTGEMCGLIPETVASHDDHVTMCGGHSCLPSSLLYPSGPSVSFSGNPPHALGSWWPFL